MSRSKTKSGSDSSAQAAPELQLIKAPANGSLVNGSAPVEPTAAGSIATAAIRRDPPAEARPAMSNGGAPAPTNGPAASEQRRTLHLSLGGNGHAPTNGGGNGHAPGSVPGNANGNGHGAELPQRPNFVVPSRPQSQPQSLDDRVPARSFQPSPSRNLPPFEVGPGTRDLYGLPEGRPLAQQPRDAEVVRKNGNFIDQELRSRVDGDIAAFLAAFDAALAADTPESRFGLREATDRLLRAGARTRIELERLEARVPLPPREGGAAADPVAWRQR